MKLLNEKIPTSHYGGHILNVKNHYSQYHTIHPELPANLLIHATQYCNGRFYFLSNHAVCNLLTKKYKIYKEYFEDYAIGYNLDECYKKYILNIDSSKIFSDF
jgi:Mor family transcriptional regulator